MGKKVASIVAKAAKLSADFACNTTSLIGGFQPAAPKQLKNNAKSEKK